MLILKSQFGRKFKMFCGDDITTFKKFDFTLYFQHPLNIKVYSKENTVFLAKEVKGFI